MASKIVNGETSTNGFIRTPGVYPMYSLVLDNNRA